MRNFVAKREWLTVFLLPAYSPDLNPVEWVWAHVKRNLANLAVVALDRLAERFTEAADENDSSPAACSGAGGTRTHGRRIMSPLL